MKIAIVIVLIVIGLLLMGVIAFVIGYIFFRTRLQHYIFAHQLLPSQMFADPVTVLAPMVSSNGYSDEGHSHLLEFWETAGEGLSEKDLASSDSLSYSMVMLGHPNAMAYLVTLPPPIKKTEAYFILMVFDAPGLACGKVRYLRYFILEYFGKKKEIPKTRIGEWIPKENGNLEYVEHCSGIPPSKETFMEKVQQIIESSGSHPMPEDCEPVPVPLHVGSPQNEARC